jgi:hypothetical protein
MDKVMSLKVAIKRLSSLDLTLFRSQGIFSGNEHVNGLALPQRVFTNEFYPSLPEIMENKQNQMMITLSIFGPGYAPEYTIQRRIQKKGMLGHYQLNGELIADPEAPERFHELRPGDFVIFEFTGDLEPVSARAVFIAKNVVVDTHLHELLDVYIGSSSSMIALEPQEFERLITQANLPEQHPANLLVMYTALEDAALNGIEGIKALRSGPFKGSVSRRVLDQVRKTAQTVGRMGEELVYAYLESKKNSGQILDFEWVADENAISPYDFSIEELDGSITLVDVKTTKTNFSNRIHVSYNELLQIQGSRQYDIYRVFDLGDNSAELRIARNTVEFAEGILNILHNLPPGVQADSVSFSPSELTFGEVEQLVFQVDESVEEV